MLWTKKYTRETPYTEVTLSHPPWRRVTKARCSLGATGPQAHPSFVLLEKKDRLLPLLGTQRTSYDPEFDAVFHCVAEPGARAMAALSPPIRATLLELAALGRVSFANHRLALRVSVLNEAVLWTLIPRLEQVFFALSEPYTWEQSYARLVERFAGERSVEVRSTMCYFTTDETRTALFRLAYKDADSYVRATAAKLGGDLPMLLTIMRDAQCSKRARDTCARGLVEGNDQETIGAALAMHAVNEYYVLDLLQRWHVLAGSDALPEIERVIATYPFKMGAYRTTASEWLRSLSGGGEVSLVLEGGEISKAQ